MAYADAAKFRSWFAGEGLRLTDYMQEVDDSVQNTLITEALSVAAVELDKILGSIGYTVPIDTDSITDRGQRQEVDRWLEKRNIDLACLELSTGVTRLPEALMDHARSIKTALESMRAGDRPHFGPRGRLRYLPAEEIPGLPL